MVICSACQRETETVAIRDCSRCRRYVALCWPCSDGKPAGTVEIQHDDCTTEGGCNTNAK